MKLFIDSANIEEIKKVNEMGILGGITTNPTLVVKELIKQGVQKPEQKSLLKEICSIVSVDVLAEPVSSKWEDIVKEGMELAKISDKIVVKIPITEDGVRAVKELKKHNIKTALTLVFSLQQALISAIAGADYICPFVGRLEDIGENGLELIKNIVSVYKNYSFKTKVIVASVRNVNHIYSSALFGADAITVPFNVIRDMFKHDLTDKGIAKFISDWQQICK